MNKDSRKETLDFVKRVNGKDKDLQLNKDEERSRAARSVFYKNKVRNERLNFNNSTVCESNALRNLKFKLLDNTKISKSKSKQK